VIDADSKKKIYPDGFYYTGDIVKIDEKKNLYFAGRENRDYIKNGYGAKVPISFLKKNYKELYSQVKHIEYYTSETSVLYQGISALIFINDKTIPKGRVTNKKIIRKITKTIKRTNKELLFKIEPFEYDHMLINRFLILNNKLPKSSKGTISKYKIDTKFKQEIDHLIKTYDTKSGVKNIVILRYRLYRIFLTCLPFKNPRFRKFFLNLFIRKN
jgi:long-subunit acyl-CoA synthetase (AMP-forming)